MSDIKDWSSVAASNNAVPPDGFPEGMAPGSVNNSAREVMAGIRSFYDNVEWRDWGHTIAYASATTFTTDSGDGDTTTIYHTNRRVKAAGTTTGTIYGYISSSNHSGQTTVTVVWDSGSLQSEALTVQVGLVADQVSIPKQAVANISPLSGTDLDIAGTTTETTVDFANDSVLMYDSSATANREVLVEDIRRVIQIVEATPYTTYASTTAIIPYDDTIPQNTEGTEYITVAITPTNTANRLLIDGGFDCVSMNSAGRITAALFQDSTANALAAAIFTNPVTSYTNPLRVNHEMAAGTTSATTFKLRIGINAGSLYINGNNAARIFGGISAVRLRVTEIKV